VEQSPVEEPRAAGGLDVIQSRIVIGGLLLAYLAGCSAAAYGAAFFCLAGGQGLEWFTYPQAILQILTVPMLVLGLVWARIRYLAMFVGVLALVALGAQQTYLERGALHCDAP